MFCFSGVFQYIVLSATCFCIISHCLNQSPSFVTLFDCAWSNTDTSVPVHVPPGFSCAYQWFWTIFRHDGRNIPSGRSTRPSTFTLIVVINVSMKHSMVQSVQWILFRHFHDQNHKAHWHIEENLWIAPVL